MSNIQQYSSRETFDSIKHLDDAGREFWFARELQEILGYTQWRNFENVIERARTACINSGVEVSGHFADVSKMVMLVEKGYIFSFFLFVAIFFVLLHCCLQEFNIDETQTTDI